MFKGFLKTCRYMAVGLGVLNLIDVLHIEYPQGSGVTEQNFSTAHCARLQSANVNGHGRGVESAIKTERGTAASPLKGQA